MPHDDERAASERLRGAHLGAVRAALEDHVARLDDDFRYGGRTVPASAFRYVLGTDPHIVEYQVRQTGDGADVLVVGSPDTATIATALVSSLRSYGLAEPRITVRVTDQLPRNAATGRLKRFVALDARRPGA